jgi:16S rRNA (cytosine967-C5)-methyltransferase
VLAPGARTFAQDQLEAETADLNDRDRRLAMDLAYGIIRRLKTLDAVLAAYASRPPAEIDPSVRNILRAGLYQILYHERVPAHAAVDESVSLTREVGRGRASGFVNGILRAILRDVTLADRADPERRQASLRLGPDRVAVFGKAFFPPARDLIASLAVRQSYPEWLVGRWVARYGAERTESLLAIGNRPAPIFVRPNARKNRPGGLIDVLADEGITAVLSPSARTVRLPDGARPGALRALAEGRGQVQDDASAAVARLLDPRPGERVLDLCAAPGGKTCHAAELMDDRGSVTAVDVSGERLGRVVENATRLGLKVIEPVEADGAVYAREHAGAYDRVLVDAPCSNTGVLRRRVEARWRLSDRAIARCADLQRRLLRAGLDALKPGGVLVYSTCSLEPEENRLCVRAALVGATGFRLDAEDQTLPHPEGGDGIYMARILRAGAAGTAS